MPTFSDEIATLALELLRGLWAEYGVNGGSYRHDWQAMDLEPLIIFTASLAGVDNVFIARTIRWCALNAPYLSTLRLRRLALRFSPATREALDVFLQAAAEPAEDPATHGESPDLKRPSLIQLRLRSLVGVGPRAEVLRLMLAEPEEQRAANELATTAGIQTRACVAALDSLTAAGLTRAEPAGEIQMYRLARPADLTIALNGVPAAFPHWIDVFVVIEAIRAYAAAPASPAGRIHSAKHLTTTLRAQLDRLGVAAQVPAIKDQSSLPDFEVWARSFVTEHAEATQGTGPHEAAYSVHRLALGGWIATVTIAGSHPRSLAISGHHHFRPERRHLQRASRDSTGEAAAVVETMLQDMITRGMQRRLGSTVSRKAGAEPRLTSLSREFAAELLVPMHPGKSTSFSERFLQRWLANRRGRHQGLTTAIAP